jgi:hypothetical protein
MARVWPPCTDAQGAHDNTLFQFCSARPPEGTIAAFDAAEIGTFRRQLYGELMPVPRPGAGPAMSHPARLVSKAFCFVLLA